MTEGYWKLFCVSHSHSQLALWCSGYNSWLRISRLWVQIQEDFYFLKEKPSLISIILNTKWGKHDCCSRLKQTTYCDQLQQWSFNNKVSRTFWQKKDLLIHWDFMLWAINCLVQNESIHSLHGNQTLENDCKVVSARQVITSTMKFAHA